MIVFHGLHEPLNALLAELTFCSTTCVRAHLLEALELFLNSTAATVVTDANEVLTGLGRLYAIVYSLGA